MSTNDQPVNLYMVQGDYKDWQVTITQTGSPSVRDLTGYTLSGDIRKEYNTEVAGSFTINAVDLTNGQFDFAVTSSTSTNLPVTSPLTSFVFDIQGIPPGSPQQPETLFWGYLKVRREVTR